MPAPRTRRTKIVATLGPASAGRVEELVRAGVDVVRLNLSHGTQEQHAAWADLVRGVERDLGRPLALIADLQGPKLRIGDLAAPIILSRGDEVVVGPEGARVDLPVAPAVLGGVLEAGHDVLIDDGHVRLRVERVDDGRAFCSVAVGGQVESHKGVNLPGVSVPIPSLTEKDVRDLEFALEHGVDYVALSFVRSPEDVRDLRRRIEDAGSTARVIAKIEKAEAVHSLGPIVEATDVVMVARGDLGVEIGPSAVPLLQKRMIQLALERGRPVITATQMLESMLHAPEPTRAEASDVANAVLDGTSALMLSEETAVGEYPVEAVATMDEIARAVEPSQGHRHELPTAGDEPTVGEAISNAACDIAEALHAVALVVPTFSGGAAAAVARLRPRRPVVAITHDERVARRLALEWGVVPLVIDACETVEQLWGSSLEAARDAGLIDAGDRVVITAGTLVNTPGSTNIIKVDVA
ncbi:MAG TPA: pyruvate kinase [Gaiellaceae bacterium]|nr:pyruvate kinase [Gaiellaceae bacterium]